MSGSSWEDGWRKVSHKARHGRKNKSTHSHGRHRKRLPEIFDREQAKLRRVRILELRAADLLD